MSGSVILEIVEGPMVGKKFEFDEHDTFILGRTEDCHMRLEEDGFVSRHHFIIEVNPPDARIRDLGSLNGTYVNGIKCGSREEGETPEEAAQRTYPEVALNDGDRIKVGDTEMLLKLHIQAICCQCNAPIPDEDKNKCVYVGDTFLCLACKYKPEFSIKKSKRPEPPRCQKCRKDVSNEIGRGRRGDYVCKSCMDKAEQDPAELLFRMLREAFGDDRSAPDIVGYEIEKRLGKGGMGVVYLARRKKGKKPVALKVMLSKIAVDDKARKEFKREMDLLKGLRHKNIVEFIDHGSVAAGFYFVMEFCDGGSVDDLMNEHGGRLPLDVAKPIMLQALEGMAYAHNKNLIHRDLKPPNLLLEGTPRRWITKVSDFGLAKNWQKAGLSGFTVTGTTAGTPMFMPREQAINFKYSKPNTDVWALGATFYNMLTGKFPRDIRRGQDPMQMVLGGEIVPIRRRDSKIPKKLAAVIDRALDNDTSVRYQTAGEMFKALKKAL